MSLLTGPVNVEVSSFEFPDSDTPTQAELELLTKSFREDWHGQTVTVSFGKFGSDLLHATVEPTMNRGGFRGLGHTYRQAVESLAEEISMRTGAFRNKMLLSPTDRAVLFQATAAFSHISGWEGFDTLRWELRERPMAPLDVDNYRAAQIIGALYHLIEHSGDIEAAREATALIGRIWETYKITHELYDERVQQEVRGWLKRK